MMQQAASRNFSVISPYGLSLDEQIGLMRDARIVAGVMGAAMTNLIYAGKGTRAVLFAPCAMPDTFFWFIANLCRLHYREFRCAQTGQGDGWNRTLDLGFRQFRRALDQEIAAL
jgi:capsular polysaccharide biosynthesis protein